MVEGMGGLESEGYAEFRALCCRAYLALREQARGRRGVAAP